MYKIHKNKNIDTYIVLQANEISDYIQNEKKRDGINN